MKNKSTYRMFKFLTNQLYSNRKYLIITIGVFLATSLVEFFIPTTSKNIIDIGMANKSMPVIIQNLAALLVLTLMLSGLNYLSSKLLSTVSQNSIVSLREDVYKQILSQNISYFETAKTGDMMGRILVDINNLQDLISPNTLSIIGNMFTFVSVFIFMFTTNKRMTLLILATFPLLFFVNYKFGKTIKTRMMESRKSSSEINNHLQNSFSSMTLIKNSGSESHEIGKFQDLSQKNKEENLLSSNARAAFSPVVDLINYLPMAIVLGFGGYMTIAGNMSVGEVVAYMAYLKLMQSPIRSFSRIFTTIQKGLVSFDRIEELLVSQPNIVDVENAKDFTSLEKEMRFEDITFSYDNKNNVLENINLSIPAKKTTALVGASGSGKTTITKLINRLYQANSGALLLDDNNIENFALDSLREKIAVVTQDVIIIDGTLRDNIAYGYPNKSEAEIIAAAKKARIWEFILTLPNALDTEVGERGFKLSGGQKQRISIARMFLKNPSIIILDEATSALDTNTEREIQRALESLAKDRTCIVVAHRLSTIINSDKIVVIDEGKIVEQGTHSSLMINKGKYAEINGSACA